MFNSRSKKDIGSVYSFLPHCSEFSVVLLLDCLPIKAREPSYNSWEESWNHPFSKSVGAFRCRMVRRHQAGLKTIPAKWRMNFLVEVNGHLAQWDRLGSTIMYATSDVRVRQICTEGFLDCNHRPGWRVSPDGIDFHVSVTKTSIQVGGFRLWFDLERAGLHQVDLPKIRYARLVSIQICEGK